MQQSECIVKEPAGIDSRVLLRFSDLVHNRFRCFTSRNIRCAVPGLCLGVPPMAFVLSNNKRFSLVLLQEDLVKVVWNLGGNAFEEGVTEWPDIVSL